MMIWLYTIYDRIAKTSSPPFGARNHEHATRMFTETLQKESMNMSNPNDFELYYIGSFDMDNHEMVDVRNELVSTGYTGTIEMEVE